VIQALRQVQQHQHGHQLGASAAQLLHEQPLELVVLAELELDLELRPRARSLHHLQPVTQQLFWLSLLLLLLLLLLLQLAAAAEALAHVAVIGRLDLLAVPPEPCSCPISSL